VPAGFSATQVLRIFRSCYEDSVLVGWNTDMSFIWAFVFEKLPVTISPACDAVCKLDTDIPHYPLQHSSPKVRALC